VPRGCRKSKQTSWDEGHGLPRGTVLRGTEKAHWGPRSHTEVLDAPPGDGDWQSGGSIVSRCGHRLGEGLRHFRQQSPGAAAHCLYKRKVGMGGKHQFRQP
jgi:hypothetical protein